MNRIGDNLHCTGSNKSFVQAFNDNGVEYILIGGLAVSWYCNDRLADDMDLLVNPTDENSARINLALSRLGYQYQSPKSFCQLGLQIPFKVNHYAELLTPRLNGPRYDNIYKSSIKGQLLGVPILIASCHILIELKELIVASGEDKTQKHQQDVERLKNYSQEMQINRT